MKIPLTPKKPEELIEEIGPERFFEFIQKNIGPEPGGNYYHWDKLRHLSPPEGLSPKEWWFAIGWARSSIAKALPFKDKNNRDLKYVPTEGLYRRLHLIDQKAGGSIATPETDLLNPDTRDRYLINSLFEEAITSSQLEGAVTTRKVAKEMLRTNRKPMNKSERMIVNNYRGMLFIREIRDEKLTPKLICELHKIVCDKTLDDEESLGKWRSNLDNIQVYDHRDGTTLHVPPNAEELEERVKKLCEFANKKDSEQEFLHPVIKAILLHFMIAYDHPFVDGNGRTARALFYWYMAKCGYWIIEFISISSVIKKSPSEYAYAFLYSETDYNDVTYFLLHQCDIILKAIDELDAYVKRKAQEQRNVDKFLKKAGNKLLNYRQTALIGHAIRHPDALFTIRSHQISHNVTYQTARTDLLSLVDMGLLQLIRRGNKFEFYVPEDLNNRLK
jgi:Fic family protein